MSALTGLVSRLRDGIDQQTSALLTRFIACTQQLGCASFSHEAKTHVDPTDIIVDL
jgi:hypothetical protein